MIVNDANELEILPVEVLRTEPKRVYISSGINGGTRVITTTLDAPIPGTKLAVSGEINEEDAADSTSAMEGSEQ